MRILPLLGRELAAALATLLGLAILVFFLVRLVPSDPARAIVGDQADRATYEMVRARLGLDKPLPEQFVIYLGQVAQGDFGKSVVTGNSVSSDILRVFPATIELAVFAIVIAMVIGVGLGVVAAANRGGWIDNVARVVGLLGYSVPTFWLGLMALILFYAKLGWLPGPGRLSIANVGLVDPITGAVVLDALIAGEWDVARDGMLHLVMPASVLGLSSGAFIARMTRNFMIEQLSQEYIVAVRAKGASLRVAIWRHAFRNTLVPLITVVALSFGFLLEGAVLTETVFALSGFGRYLTTGLLSGDVNAVVACTLLAGAVFIGINRMSDFLYHIMDPRLRSRS
ncbi:ABC transporter permease [Bosea sp. 2KB_26]|uniref:ABC transporter permease n=1 Tax=Bosea sp. 2KB_26 TaxID=3237475 RepID=UPI003F8F82B3